ncbi:MAG: hypothetical protein JWP32_272 [Schumannella sp.]|nr:hypothetical protein [Schumannella sp.]
MRRAAAAAGTAALLLLTGCSAFPGGFPTATPSGSASPSSTAVPIGAVFGDVAARESVTDDLGTYLHVTLSPAAAVATEVDPATVGDLIAGSSWDDASLLAAQRFVATFVAEQAIDSSALDRDEAGWQGWLASTAPVYFGENAATVIGKPAGGTDRPTPIFNDPNDSTPILVRDGLARLDDATITVTELQNEPREGGERLRVTGSADVAYRLSDEEAIVYLLDQGYDQDSIDGFGQLSDGEDGHLLTHLDWSYSVERSGDAWLIRSYTLTTDSNIEGVSQA